MRKLFNHNTLKAIVFMAILPMTAKTQAVLYNPQTLYDSPGGLYDQGTIREMNIQFYDANYHSTLVNSFFNYPSYRIPAVVSIDGISYDSVGVRYKGNSTFCLPNDDGNPKVPYNLDANYWISGQKIADYKKLKFANAWMDPTFAKEITATNIYQKYMPSPEVSLLKVKVQGNYLGLYVNTESINKQFMEKHFGEKDGVLFKCDPAQVFCGSTNPGGNPDLKWLGSDSTSYYNSYALKSESGWEELMDLIYTLNFSYEDLGEVLNIDRVLWNFAVNTAILNLDTYNGYYVHNYYLYKTEDGLFQMIPWDFDNAFVGAILGFDYWSPEVVYNYDSYGSQYDPNSRPLFQKLMADPLRKKQFDAHLRTVFSESLLDTSSIRNEIADLHDQALIPANQDFNKAFPMTYFYSNVEEPFWAGWGFAGIMSTIVERNNYLMGLPAITNTPPSLSSVSLNNGIVTVIAGNTNEVELMVTTSPHNSRFVPFPMYDDGTNGDDIAGDGIFSAALPYYSTGQAVKYYIRAQNNNSMRLSPERAEYEFYIYDPNASVIEEEAISYKVYPNPSKDIINITSSSNLSLNCVVYNLSGQKLVEKQTVSSYATIDVSAFKPGIYMLKINNQIKKIIKE
jgi:hypothetical protein